MRRSYGKPFAHSLNSEMPTENHYDWTQEARRSSYNIDSLGNVCICASRNLRTGSFPGDVSKQGHAQWRCANACRQNGLGVTWWRCRCLYDKQCLCGNALG